MNQKYSNDVSVLMLIVLTFISVMLVLIDYQQDELMKTDIVLMKTSTAILDQLKDNANTNNTNLGYGFRLPEGSKNPDTKHL